MTQQETLSAPMRAFFTEFHERLDELTPSFYYLLKTYKISETFNPLGHAPMTTSKLRMMHMSKPISTVGIEELIEDATPGVTRQIISMKVNAACCRNRKKALCTLLLKSK